MRTDEECELRARLEYYETLIESLKNKLRDGFLCLFEGELMRGEL